MRTKEDILSDGHWKSGDYKQRITTKDWKTLLLNNEDRVIFQGRFTNLIGKSLGFGVVEVSKELNENINN